MSSLTAKTASFPALPEAAYNNLGSELNLAGFLLISLTILEYLLSEASFSVCFISDKLYFLFCKLFKISSDLTLNRCLTHLLIVIYRSY